MVNLIPMSLRTSIPGILSILLILVAYIYKKSADEELREQLDNILKALLRAEGKVGLVSEPKVAVGFGACMDSFVNALEILEKFKAESPNEAVHFPHITNREQLEKMFAYFFQHGAAAERYLTNSTLFEELVQIARDMPDTRWVVGGNAPVMASRFQQEGCKVLLGAEVSTSFHSLISPKIKVSGGKIKEDDIHLIMEYKTADRWGKFTSPRANRFILHNDDHNPTLSSLESFSEEMKMFSPSLLVVGGLQMLDNFPFPAGGRVERLGKLRDVLVSMPTTSKIHFEMASFADEATFQDVVENVVYYSDSLGMNEQELPNLHSMLTNSSITLISDSYPRVATVLDHLRTVYKTLRDTPLKPGQRRVSRLHVHTLAYQAILTTKGSDWKNTMSAAAKASLTANRHVCGSKTIKTEKARIIMDEAFSTSRSEGSRRMPLDPERPVSCWEEEDFEICLAPVLVCTEVVQTAGGGDNISSAGLVLQI